MADTETTETSTGPLEPQSRQVVYCGGKSISLYPSPQVCSLPPEYCEFGGTVKKCQDWLQEAHPDLYEQIWSADALEAATSSLSVDARKRAEKDAHKKALKAEAAEAKQAATIATSKVIIKRVERTKRKYVTAVSGLEAFGLDNKKMAKDFGKKFATGSGVTKLPSGGEEIIVQGDVSDDIEEFLLDHYKVIPEDNIQLVEDKKKKKDTAGG